VALEDRREQYIEEAKAKSEKDGGKKKGAKKGRHEYSELPLEIMDFVNADWRQIGCRRTPVNLVVHRRLRPSSFSQTVTIFSATTPPPLAANAAALCTPTIAVISAHRSASLDLHQLLIRPPVVPDEQACPKAGDRTPMTCHSSRCWRIGESKRW